MQINKVSRTCMLAVIMFGGMCSSCIGHVDTDEDAVVPCHGRISPEVYKLLCPKRASITLKKLPLDIKFDEILKKSNVVPIAILGSGPAGLSAALYGSRAKIRTLVISGEKPGGQLMETTKIENWPGKRDVLAADAMEELKQQAFSFGAEFLTSSVEKVDFSTWPYKLWTDSGKQINALSVIISTGASPRRLEAPGVQEFWGAGVSACAICDAPFFKNKDVVIVGGGDAAIEEATILSAHVKSVKILVRKDSLKASAVMQKRLEKLSNVKVLFNHEIKEILGNEEGVTNIKLFDSKNNKTYDMKTDGVFLAIGHIPNTKLFTDWLELTPEGYIKLACRTQQTSLPGIFSAGDVSDSRYKQAGKAAGDGIAAALDAIEFLGDIGLTPEISNKLSHVAFDVFEGEEAPVVAIDSVDALVTNVLRNKKLAVLFVGSADCVTCPAMHRAFKLVSHRFLGRADFFEIDAAQAAAVVKDERVHVAKIPCLLLYQGGKLLARHYTVMNKHEMYDYILQFIEN